MPPLASSTGVSITNPLVLYRSLVSTNRIQADPAQLRLALHLQTLYGCLKDYEPVAQYGWRLQQLQRTLGSTPANPAPGTSHDVPRQSIFSSIFEKQTSSGANNHLALTKVLTSHEEAMKIDSPQGLLLHGEVGTGKSMLVDLFAECLPTRKKRRLHYNTFMLEILAKLERLRRSRELIVPASLGQEEDYSLLWLARDLISTCPILFLDEFQLPDRAAAKILTNLMTCFFQLGGVLVATSNRMPEELDKAARMTFSPPSARTGLRGLGISTGSKQSNKKSEFADFLDLLRARCDVWQMEGVKDYRRSEAHEESLKSLKFGSAIDPATEESGLVSMATGNLGLVWEQSKSTFVDGGPVSQKTSPTPSQTPKFYNLSDETPQDDFIASILGRSVGNVPWTAQSLSVYGRNLRVPRTHQGITLFSFAEICSNALGPTAVLGPADYATLASHFHTFILTDVPTLSLLQKNEARRLITLLDSLYEAKCKLAISAKAAPDFLFFPETIDPLSSPTNAENVDQDATYSETLSEIYQDTTAPFRPNVSVYADPNSSATPPDGADATHARFAGLLDEDRAEQQRKLAREHEASTVDVGDAKLIGYRTQAADTTATMTADTESGPTLSSSNRAPGPDFSMAAFTGEDEKFAFKRAQSRLWEMCSARWWVRRHEGSDESDGIHSPSWWQPLSSNVRVWEHPRDLLVAKHDSSNTTAEHASHLEGIGQASSIHKDNDAVLFRHRATSPFRSSHEAPPQFNWTHAWGMIRWGKKAGEWGQGTDIFKDENSKAQPHVEGESTDEYVQRRKAWRQHEPSKGDQNA